MKLSNIGELASHIWIEIPQHFQGIELDEFVVMPNHMHGIIIIHNDGEPIGRDAINRVSTGGVTARHNPMLTNALGKIIRWYKGRCTYEK
jgi:REP-associated tyrosine transposase